MEWLGFTLENNLLKPQESKVKSIKEFPVPITAKQVISFVSLASFYRRFIKDFARIAKPMHDVAKTDPFEWTDKAQEAFEALKEAMCSDTVLRMPRQGETFQLYTDASHIAISPSKTDLEFNKTRDCYVGTAFVTNTSQFRMEGSVTGKFELINTFKAVWRTVFSY